MSKLVITTITVILFAVTGFAQANGHADHQTQIENLKQEKSALQKRLNNAIAFSKSRGAQLDSEKRQRVALSKRLNNAIAFSKSRGAQLDSEKRQRVALSKRLNNAIAFSKSRGAQLDSEKRQRVALSKRLNNAIAFSKARGKKLKSTDGNAQSVWAAKEGAALNSAIGGVQGTEVNITNDSVKIQVGNNGLFRTGGTRLSVDGNQLLSLIANELSANDSNITVVGHTDNIPVGNSNAFSNNEALSFARAVSTMQFLRTQGISNERLSAAGYGDSRPIASNDTPEGRKQNRRVEIIVRKY